MTILNKVLTFNQPQKELVCQSCDGTGKWKSSSAASTTYLLIASFCILGFISLLSLPKYSDYRFLIFLGLLIISLAFLILSAIEYKQQTDKHGTNN